MFFEPSICGRPYLYSDSAACSVSSRIVATLTMHLQPAHLLQALNEALVRFPQMAVTVVPEGERYRYTPAPGPVKVFLADDCAQPACYGDARLGGYLFKVSYIHKTVYFDFHKSLADEYGMMTFAKAVLFRYLQIAGYPVENDGTIKQMSGTFFSAEGEDPMEKMEDIQASRPIWYMDADAFRPEIQRRDSEKVVTVRIPLSKIPREMEEISKTPVTYIAPIFSQVVSELYDDRIQAGKYVVASIMVNLRPYFPAASLRPFCTPVFLAYNRKLTDYPFRTVLMSQKKLLEAQLKPDALAYSALRSVLEAETIVQMNGPLEDRKSKVAEKMAAVSDMSTYIVCRVGNMILPDSMQRLVTDFYPVISSASQAFALSVIVYRGEIHVTITGASNVEQAGVRFARLLCENEIGAYVSDNFDYTPMHYHP